MTRHIKKMETAGQGAAPAITIPAVSVTGAPEEVPVPLSKISEINAAVDDRPAEEVKKELNSEDDLYSLKNFVV